MKQLRVLFISQEIKPYLPENQLSKLSRKLPQAVQEAGHEIRTFMPRYGCINERRHQLHEVIRLSGMNLIINDHDHPLIIKVASIPTARMQVYFIDNEEYFQRKAVLEDKEGKFFGDNDERSIFFCRGVIETIKKLGWAPDIIHCHGWMTSLVPAYIKKSFADDPNFAESKVVYSLYNNGFNGTLDKTFADKAVIEGLNREDLDLVNTPDVTNLHKLAAEYADGVILGESEPDAGLNELFEGFDKPKLAHPETDDYIESYDEFYQEVYENSSLLVE